MIFNIYKSPSAVIPVSSMENSKGPADVSATGYDSGQGFNQLMLIRARRRRGSPAGLFWLLWDGIKKELLRKPL